MDPHHEIASISVESLPVATVAFAFILWYFSYIYMSIKIVYFPSEILWTISLIIPGFPSRMGTQDYLKKYLSRTT